MVIKVYIASSSGSTSVRILKTVFISPPNLGSDSTASVQLNFAWTRFSDV